MNFIEQFKTKEYNEEQLMKGYVNNLSYPEYLYYLACLSDYFYTKRKYERSLFFYDHLLKSVGCAVLLKKYGEIGKKIPKELKKYTIDLEDITTDPLMDTLGKRIDKIATKHTTKKFAFQLLTLIIGTLVGLIAAFVFHAEPNIALIIGLVIACFSPLFYRPKPITLSKTIALEKTLAYVSRHNKDLLEFVHKHIKNEQILNKTKEKNEENENKESAEN